MSGRILTLPRVVAVAAVVLLVSATIALAADKPAPASKPKSQAKAPQQVLVVPNVQGQLFVFSSGTLEDNGFGWKVRGAVHGFPANRVVRQSPKPGTHVVNTGAPTITLWLARGTGPEVGLPQDRSQYGASLIRRARHANSG
ncbi:PASTA domain-containing protein [Jatrophihabitans sp.]|uniref:PASTA domain-containing protein n=1 Tax=Jatrophihabitans sp. TaxID=1932789 RepID=UPI003F7CE355